MFCHACGAKNADESRFCHMCGTPFVRASQPLDSTQVGVAGAFADAARAAVAAERARGGAAVPPPVALPPASDAPSRPSQTNPAPTESALGIAAPTPSDAQVPVSAGVAPAPAPSDSSPSLGAGAAPPVLSVTSSVSMRGMAQPAFGDPSMSIRLESIGIASTRRTYTVLALSGLALLLVGAGITYASMRADAPASPRGTAHAGDPFEIGTPTPDVDFVSGTPTNPAAHATAPAVPPATGPVAPIAPTSSGRTPPGPSTTPTPGPTHPSLPVPDPVRDPGPSPTPDPTPTPTPPPDPTPTPEPTQAPTTESDLELYSSRVRYLVRRYYAGRAQSCFDRATADAPSLSGQVVVGFHVGSDGHVTSARVVRNTTGDDALGSCLAQQAQAWELAPPPSGGVDLTMPFSR